MRNPQVSKATNTSPDPKTQIEANRYWRFQFIESMKFASPDFVVDDRNKALISDLYAWYLGDENGNLNPSKGLLFWGGLGVGKSTLLKGIQNFEWKVNLLCHHGRNDLLGFPIVSAAEFSLQYARNGVDTINKYKSIRSLGIDEVGREPMDSKHFGTNINPVQLLIQLRYENRYNGLTHITTNMDPNTEFEVYGGYVVDRVKEMFNVIEVTGESRR